MIIYWTKTELIQFFGAEPDYSSICESYSFSRVINGIRIEFTLFDCEGAAYLSLYRADNETELITIQREGCTHAQVVKSPTYKYCLEVGSSFEQTQEISMPPKLQRGIRIALEPDIHVEFIDTEERGTYV